MSFLARIKRWLPFTTFDRYVAGQLLLSVFIAVLVLSVVLVLGQVFRALYELLLRDQLPIEKLPQLLWNMFGSSLSYTVPWGILTGVLLVFGRLSADNELTAMRMAGMSLLRICFPILILAALMSVGCFWINTKVAPGAYKETRTQKYALALESPTKLFVENEVLDAIPGYTIYCKEKDGEHLKHFVAFNFVGEYDPPDLGLIMVAKESAISASVQTKSIDVRSTDLRMLRYEYKDYDAEGKVISKEQLLAMRDTGEKPAETKLSVLPANGFRTFDSTLDLGKFFTKATRPRVAGMSMSELQQVYAALTGKDPNLLAIQDETMRGHILNMTTKERNLMSLDALTTYNSRYSFSMACFVLCLCGISFGITAQRRDTSSGFVLSLVVGIAYFALIMLAEIWKGKPEMHPELWVWLPNAVFGIIGLGLFLKHSRR